MKNIFKKLQQRRLRWILRGHRELKQTSNQGKIYQVMQDVVATALSPENVYSKRLYGVALAEAELVTRQYLIARTVVGTHFSKALLYACKKPRAWVTHPLPTEWRSVVRQHGFKVPRFWSSLIWHAYVIFLLSKSILAVWKRAFDGIRASFESVSVPKPYVYFSGLTVNNTPQTQNGSDSYDIISWYSQWQGRIKNVGMFYHNVRNLHSCSVNGIPVSSCR